MKGVLALERILTSYAINVKQIGYTQGMNFICATFLYHSKEFVAFSIFNAFMEKYMSEIYSENLIGLHVRTSQIQKMINTEPILHSISLAFVRIGMEAIIYASEWILTLFCSILPLSLNVRK